MKKTIKKMRTANGRNQQMPKNVQETTKKWPRQMTEKWPNKYFELQTGTKISQTSNIYQIHQNWINIESTKVSTCFNPEFASSRLNALRSAFDSSSWHECVNPAKAIACTKKNMEKEYDAFVRKIIRNDMKCWWLFDDYLMFIWCLFVS